MTTHARLRANQFDPIKLRLTQLSGDMSLKPKYSPDVEIERAKGEKARRSLESGFYISAGRANSDDRESSRVSQGPSDDDLSLAARGRDSRFSRR